MAPVYAGYGYEIWGEHAGKEFIWMWIRIWQRQIHRFIYGNGFEALEKAIYLNGDLSPKIERALNILSLQIKYWIAPWKQLVYRLWITIISRKAAVWFGRYGASNNKRFRVTETITFNQLIALWIMGADCIRCSNNSSNFTFNNVAETKWIIDKTFITKRLGH